MARYVAREKAARSLFVLLIVIGVKIASVIGAAFIVMSILASMGCGTSGGLTEATEVLTANEEMAVSFTKCYTKDSARGEADVYFSEETRHYPQEYCDGRASLPEGIAFVPQMYMNAAGDCVAAAWAQIDGNYVTFWREWVNDPVRTRYNFMETSAHEATHLIHYYSKHDSVFWQYMKNLMDSKGECK